MASAATNEEDGASASPSPSHSPAPRPEPTPTPTPVEEEREFKDKFKTHRISAETVDHYEALGLAHLRWRATQQQIRTAFRKMSLQYHPDRLGPGADDSVFKRISKAYEILADEAKRKVYDSQEVFDDAIPSEKEASECEFYSLFAAVFDRNSMWSAVEPVPRLGDDSSSDAEVDRFYDFWFQFKSWREFQLEEAYDPEEASSREEKRWMQRQNEKMMQSKKKEEHARVRKLVDLASRKDPRLQRRRDAEKAEKDARKQQRRAEIEAKVREEREEKERVVQEKVDKELAEKRAKDEKQRVVSKSRAMIDKVVLKTGRTKADTDAIVAWETSLGKPLQAIVEVAARLEQVVAADLEVVSAAVQAEFERIGREKKLHEEEVDRSRAEIEKERKAKDEAEEKAKKGSGEAWSDEELGLLARATLKYPAGVHERWEKIAVMLGHGRTQEEIIAKTQEIKKRDARGMTTRDAYGKLKREIHDKPIESPLDVNWERVNKTQSPKAPTPTPVAPVAPVAAAAAAAPVVAPVASWSAEQQKKLEEGLRTFKGKDKWDKIAELVATKTKDECKERFDFLRQSLLKQQLTK